MNLIGVLGRKGVGKDLIADYLVTKYGYTKRSFAGPLKRASQVLFGFTERQIYGDQKEVVDPRWGVAPRKVLQWLGTEVFRNHIQTLLPQIKDNFWIQLALNDLTEEKRVISDVRFLNEVRAMREKGGKVIKVIRPTMSSQDTHESEVGIDSIGEYDYQILNGGSIEELYAKLDAIMAVSTLRLATEKDYPRIGELNLASFKPYFTAKTNVIEKTRRLTDVAKMAEGAMVWVALLDEQVVGFIVAEFSETPKYPEFPIGSVCIRSLTVDSTHRRKGIGTALIQRVLQEAQGLGRTSVVVRTAQNMIEAQKTYEKIGFERVPDLDWPNPHFNLLAYSYKF